MLTKQIENIAATTTPWLCRGCGAGWFSQPAETAHTWRLYEIAEPLVDPPSAPAAWIVSGPDPSACPRCCSRMVLDDGMAQAAIN